MVRTCENLESLSLLVPMRFSKQQSLCSSCAILATSCILAFSGKYIIWYFRIPRSADSSVFASSEDNLGIGTLVCLNNSICDISCLVECSEY